MGSLHTARRGCEAYADAIARGDGCIAYEQSTSSRQVHASARRSVGRDEIPSGPRPAPRGIMQVVCRAERNGRSAAPRPALPPLSASPSRGGSYAASRRARRVDGVTTLSVGAVAASSMVSLLELAGALEEGGTAGSPCRGTRPHLRSRRRARRPAPTRRSCRRGRGRRRRQAATRQLRTCPNSAAL